MRLGAGVQITPRTLLTSAVGGGIQALNLAMLPGMFGPFLVNTLQGIGSYLDNEITAGNEQLGHGLFDAIFAYQAGRSLLGMSSHGASRPREDGVQSLADGFIEWLQGMLRGSLGQLRTFLTGPQMQAVRELVLFCPWI